MTATGFPLQTPTPTPAPDVTNQFEQALRSIPDIDNLGIHIVLAVVVLIVGAWLARFVRRRLKTAVVKAPVTSSVKSLLVTIGTYGIWILTATLALIALGLPVSTVLAVFAVVLIILGIALQESLKDFAAAVNFRLFRPFEAGEYVQIGTVMGTVHEMLLFTTTIMTAENKLVSIANSQIQTTGSINFSRAEVLRPLLTFGVSYASDLALVRRILEEEAQAHPKVVSDPPPVIMVNGLGESDIEVGLRVSVRFADYWTAQSDLRERVKARFDEVGIVMWIPQLAVRDVAPTPGA